MLEMKYLKNVIMMSQGSLHTIKKSRKGIRTDWLADNQWRSDNWSFARGSFNCFLAVRAVTALSFGVVTLFPFGEWGNGFDRHVQLACCEQACSILLAAREGSSLLTAES
jgi:hypothetical protein